MNEQTMNKIEKILDKPEIHVMTDFDHAKLKEELSNLIAKKEREALFGYIAYLENLKNREIAVKSLSGLPDKRIKIPMLFGWYRDRAKDYLVSEYRAEYGRANSHDTPEERTYEDGLIEGALEQKKFHETLHGKGKTREQIRKEAIEGFVHYVQNNTELNNYADSEEAKEIVGWFAQYQNVILPNDMKHYFEYLSSQEEE